MLLHLLQFLDFIINFYILPDLLTNGWHVTPTSSLWAQLLDPNGRCGQLARVTSMPVHPKSSKWMGTEVRAACTVVLNVAPVNTSYMKPYCRRRRHNQCRNILFPTNCI